MFLSWLPFSILATLCFGVSASLYKMPTIKGHSRASGGFWMMLAGALLSIAFFHTHLLHPGREALILGLLFGLSFAVTMMAQMYALTHVDTNTLFPITTTLSLVTAIGVGLVIFAERLSELQILGVILAIISVYFFVYHKGQARLSPLILWVGVSIFSFSAFSKIVQKIAADSADIFAFQIYLYIFGAIFLFVAYLATNKRDIKGLFSKAAFWGSLNGILSFFGGWAILTALTMGPFTLITAIHSTYVLVTAIIGWLFFKENLTAKKIFLICLAIVAIIMMRVG